MSAALLLGGVILQVGVAGAAPTEWSVTPSPNQSSGANQLTGVSCTSLTNCIGVGYYTNGSGQIMTLIESWDGASWSVMSSVNPSATENELSGVSCTSPTNCEAVGGYANGSNLGQTLVESWDGTNWSVIPSANSDSADNTFTGVSCISSLYCTAVGYGYGGSGLWQTLAESWDGTTWSIGPSPDPGHDNVLNGVSCTSSTRCQAVGYASNIDGIFQATLIESWDGTSWSIVPSPNPGFANALNGVSCVSSTSCEAVGNYAAATIPTKAQSAIETWNGVQWSVATSRDPGSGEDDLTGVSCTSTNDCEAVGVYANKGSGAMYTLVESWSGSAWTVATSPNPSVYNALSGVSCTDSTDCQAVGNHTTPATGQTLVETGFAPGPPTIASISPAAGPVGTKVTITGTNLLGATKVSFHGTPAVTVTKDTATTIKVLVPARATNGPIKVVTPGGTVKSTTDFTVT
jgi:IPT/TIG domain